MFLIKIPLILRNISKLMIMLILEKQHTEGIEEVLEKEVVILHVIMDCKY